MTDLEKLQQAVIKFRDERDWKQFHNPKDEAIALVEEAVELLEMFRWKTEAESREFLKTNSEEISEEVIDVLHWALLIAHDYGVDIEKAFDRKMKKNILKYPVSKSRGNPTKYTKL